MENPQLDEAAFQALDPGNRGAFLPLVDATSVVQEAYRVVGLRDDPEKPDQRRIARVVELREGMRLFKLSQYEEKWERDRLSPWWSASEPYEENDLGAREVFETAVLNHVTMRDLVRFISAVSLDWNLLNWMIEVTLTVDIKAFWGQFTPQAGIQNAPPDGTTVAEKAAPGGEDTYVTYQDGDEAYVSNVLGGFGAWQMYVPDFSKAFIDPGTIVNVSSTDTAALAAHFGVSADRIAELERMGEALG